MAQTIELPDPLYRRLRAISQLDPPIVVIERLVERFEREAGVVSPPQRPMPGNGSAIHRFGPSSAPDFTHTRVLGAYFAGQATARPKWSGLVRKAHETAFGRVGTVDALIRLTTANVCEGIRTEDGFRPVPGHPFSIQGVDANNAWRISYDLARKLKCSVLVEFEWRAKDEAEFPGERGLIEWAPEQIG